MTRKSLARLAALAILLPLAPGALAQQISPTPMAAAEALVDGIARHDEDAVRAALGADYRKLMSVANPDPDDVTTFLEAWARSRRIVPSGDAKAHLEVGRYGWTLPIPLVKGTAGWSFDTAAAGDEIRTRRIGRNELAAIKAMLAYADAQDDFNVHDLSANRRDDYAQRLVSSPGKRDGLYWPTKEGEPPSPGGPLLAQANQQYRQGVATPYHGYYYRILTAQGKNAPDGAMSYYANGKLIGGVALIAYPAKYRNSGVKTFICNMNALVYEKDLGPDTVSKVKKIKSYDPDETWTKVN